MHIHSLILLETEALSGDNIYQNFNCRVTNYMNGLENTHASLRLCGTMIKHKKRVFHPFSIILHLDCHLINSRLRDIIL
jgi:hypothetical protein